MEEERSIVLEEIRHPKERTAIYRRVFDTPDGRAVLNDICNYGLSSGAIGIAKVHPDVLLNRIEGRREVVGMIFKRLQYKQSKSLINKAMKKETI